MKFFDKLYVGFQRQRYVKGGDTRLLGFSVPADDNKRRETIDRWSDNYLDSRTFDNIPIRGFKLCEVVSRYRTSNKFFRVLDPRGFELEISADNLLNLCLNSTIVKGEIIDECVWASDRTITPVPKDDPGYIAWKKQKTEGKTKFEEGKYYFDPGNVTSVFRFEGIYHHTYLTHNFVIGDYKEEQANVGRYSYSTREVNILIKDYTAKVKIHMNSGNRPSYIYTEFCLDQDGNVRYKIVHARKSHFKKLIPYNDEISQDMSNFKFNPLDWINEGRFGKKDREKPTLNINCEGAYHGFAKTKEEARNLNYNQVIKDNIEPKNSFDFCNYRNLIRNGQGRFWPSYSPNFYWDYAGRNIQIEDKR